MSVELEARTLANRFCMQTEVVEQWMKANSLSSIMDLKKRYPGKSHAKAMDLALDEIWEFGMSR